MHVYQLRGVRDFSFMQPRVVCLCVYMTINSTVYFTWHKRGEKLRIVCHRWGQVVFASVVIFQWRFHVGAAGVCDRFHHLDILVLMNILIISRNARACWVSSHTPLPEVNMETHGPGLNALQCGGGSPTEASFACQETRS